MTKALDYMYHINSLLQKDEENGLITSFVLQLDSILAESTFESPTEQRLIGETIQFLHCLTEGNVQY